MIQIGSHWIVSLSDYFLLVVERMKTTTMGNDKVPLNQ